jgi:hypothetical protein
MSLRVGNWIWRLQSSEFSKWTALNLSSEVKVIFPTVRTCRSLFRSHEICWKKHFARGERRSLSKEMNARRKWEHNAILENVHKILHEQINRHAGNTGMNHHNKNRNSSTNSSVFSFRLYWCKGNIHRLNKQLHDDRTFSTSPNAHKCMNVSKGICDACDTWEELSSWM